MSFARNFKIKEGMNLQIRGEFQNIFNRTFLAAPLIVGTNPAFPVGTTTYAGSVINSSGFGSITTVGATRERNRAVVGSLPGCF